MRHYCARGTSNGNVLLYKSPFFAWIILNDSTTVYINLATNLPAVSFLFYSLLGTLWNSQRMVNIITLSLCSLNTQNGRARNWTKKILGGKSSVHVTIYSTLCTRCDVRAEFSRSLNWLLNAFFQKLEPTVWLVKLKQIRGSSQKHAPYFSKTPFPDFTCLFLFHPKAVPNTAQTHSSTAAYFIFPIKVTYCEASLPQRSTTVWTHDNIQNQELNVLSLSLPICSIQHIS